MLYIYFIKEARVLNAEDTMGIVGAFGIEDSEDSVGSGTASSLYSGLYDIIFIIRLNNNTAFINTNIMVSCCDFKLFNIQ